MNHTSIRSRLGQTVPRIMAHGWRQREQSRSDKTAAVLSTLNILNAQAERPPRARHPPDIRLLFWRLMFCFRAGTATSASRRTVCTITPARLLTSTPSPTAAQDGEVRHFLGPYSSSLTSTHEEQSR